MIQFKKALILLLWGSLSFPTDATAKADAAHCNMMFRNVWEHSLAQMKALENTTSYFYWGRARVALDATPNQKLEEIFSKTSKKDLEELFWGIKSGEIKVSRDEEKMVEELWHMVDDLGDKPFWGQVPDRGFAIREALRAHDAKLSFSGDPAFAAQLTDRALAATEVEVLGRAIAEHARNKKYPNSRWFDKIVRFFSPHYEKVKTVLETNNSIRRRLQKMYEADKSALEAIAKYKMSLKLTDSELKEIEAQASDTAGQLATAREDIANLYGREVSSKQPLPEAEVRIRELAKRAIATHSQDKEAELALSAEKDMDTIDRVVGGAWDRTHQTHGGMPVSEKNDVHLQIRNPQYRRETPERRQAYLGVTKTRSPGQSAYNVETEWTVTVNHEEPKTREATRIVETTNPDGSNSTSTETYLENYTDYYTTHYQMTRKDVLKARYEEVLANKVNPSDHISDLPSLPPAQERGAYAVSASNGAPEIVVYDRAKVSAILEGGKNARSAEVPFRTQMEHATSVVDSVTNEAYQLARKTPGSSAKILGALESEQKSLIEARAKLIEYQKLNPEQIATRWPQDIVADFKDRNQRMLVQYDHMITRVEHLAEQVRRNSPSLVIEYVQPDYSAQLAQLKAIKDQNRKIIIQTSGAAVAGGASYVGYQYRDEIKSFVQDLVRKRQDNQ